MPITGPEEIKKSLKKEEYVIGALLTLHNKTNNAVINKLTNQYLKKGSISEQQLKLIRPHLYKYIDKLDELGGLFPVKNKKKKEKEVLKGKRKQKHVAFFDDKKHKFIVFSKKDSLLEEELKKVDSTLKYHPDVLGSYWIVSANAHVLQLLEDRGFTLAEEVKEWKKTRVSLSKISDELHIPNMKKGMGLRPFQNIAVNFIQNRKGRALIADQMGLGKSVEAWAWCLLNAPDIYPVLIVCPATAKYTWEHEIQKFTEDLPKIEILEGRTPYIFNAEVVIINYDILMYWSGILAMKEFKTLIADEAHKIKHINTKRTVHFNKIAQKTPHLIGLTGTPIENRPIEIYNIANLIDRSLFPSRWRFGIDFCDLKRKPDYSGASNTARLHQVLTKEIMLRRTTEEVLPDMPQKQYIVNVMSLNNTDEYMQAEEDFIQFLRRYDPKKVTKAKRGKALSKISYLKKLSIEGKLNNCIQWIKDILETEDKFVVFADRKFVIARLMEEFKGMVVKIDGDVPTKQRHENVQRFQTDPSIKLFAGNLVAASENITLTAANKGAFLEFPFSPGRIDQAGSRILRIGQEANSVMLYYLIGKNTIDEHIINLVDAKRININRIVDGKETEEGEIVSELINIYKRKGE